MSNDFLAKSITSRIYSRNDDDDDDHDNNNHSVLIGPMHNKPKESFLWNYSRKEVRNPTLLL